MSKMNSGMRERMLYGAVDAAQNSVGIWEGDPFDGGVLCGIGYADFLPTEDVDGAYIINIDPVVVTYDRNTAIYDEETDEETPVPERTITHISLGSKEGPDGTDSTITDGCWATTLKDLSGAPRTITLQVGETITFGTGKIVLRLFEQTDNI